MNHSKFNYNLIILVLKFLATQLNDENDIYKKEETYINQKSLDLGLNPNKLSELNTNRTKNHILVNVKYSPLNPQSHKAHSRYSWPPLEASSAKIHRTKKGKTFRALIYLCLWQVI